MLDDPLTVSTVTNVELASPCEGERAAIALDGVHPAIGLWAPAADGVKRDAPFRLK